MNKKQKVTLEEVFLLSSNKIKEHKETQAREENLEEEIKRETFEKIKSLWDKALPYAKELYFHIHEIKINPVIKEYQRYYYHDLKLICLINPDLVDKKGYYEDVEKRDSKIAEHVFLKEESNGPVIRTLKKEITSANELLEVLGYINPSTFSDKFSRVYNMIKEKGISTWLKNSCQRDIRYITKEEINSNIKASIESKWNQCEEDYGP